MSLDLLLGIAALILLTLGAVLAGAGSTLRRRSLSRGAGVSGLALGLWLHHAGGTLVSLAALTLLAAAALSLLGLSVASVSLGLAGLLASLVLLAGLIPPLQAWRLASAWTAPDLDPPPLTLRDHLVDGARSSILLWRARRGVWGACRWRGEDGLSLMDQLVGLRLTGRRSPPAPGRTGLPFPPLVRAREARGRALALATLLLVLWPVSALGVSLFGMPAMGTLGLAGTPLPAVLPDDQGGASPASGTEPQPSPSPDREATPSTPPTAPPQAGPDPSPDPTPDPLRQIADAPSQPPPTAGEPGQEGNAPPSPADPQQQSPPENSPPENSPPDSTEGAQSAGAARFHGDQPTGADPAFSSPEGQTEGATGPPSEADRAGAPLSDAPARPADRGSPTGPDADGAGEIDAGGQAGDGLSGLPDLPGLVPLGQSEAAAPDGTADRAADGSSGPAGDADRSAETAPSDTTSQSPPQGQGQGTDPQSQGQGTDPQGQGQGSDPQGQGQGSDPQSPGQGTDPQGQGQGTDPQGQGQGSDPQGQGQGSDPQSPGQGTDPQGQGQGTDPQGQGQGTDPQDQGQGTDPQSQGQGTDPQGQGQGTDPQGQGNGTTPGAGAGTEGGTMQIAQPETLPPESHQGLEASLRTSEQAGHGPGTEREAVQDILALGTDSGGTTPTSGAQDNRGGEAALNADAQASGRQSPDLQPPQAGPQALEDLPDLEPLILSGTSTDAADAPPLAPLPPLATTLADDTSPAAAPDTAPLDPALPRWVQQLMAEPAR